MRLSVPYMENAQIEGVVHKEKKLYDLIWKRTIASQMADAELEKTTATISISNTSGGFQCHGRSCEIRRFSCVYTENLMMTMWNRKMKLIFATVKERSEVRVQNITATERFTPSTPLQKQDWCANWRN